MALRKNEVKEVWKFNETDAEADDSVLNVIVSYPYGCTWDESVTEN